MYIIIGNKKRVFMKGCKVFDNSNLKKNTFRKILSSFDCWIFFCFSSFYECLYHSEFAKRFYNNYYRMGTKRI